MTSKMHHYEIDYFRVLGALGVLFYHYTYRLVGTNADKVPLFSSLEHFTKFGYLGLNLFFLISGFVILWSASEKSALRFAISRMDRLYPAYWVCVTISALTVVFIGEGSVTPIQYISNLTMLNDYLNIDNIDGVYWTLHVELKFYAIVFVLILLNLVRKHYVWLTLWTIVTTSYLIWGQPISMGWYISPFYSSFFISGICFYLIQRDGPQFRSCALLSINFAISLQYTYNQTGGFVRSPSEIDRLVACTFIMAFFVLFYLFVVGRLRLPRIDIIKKLSALTYVLYLIHAGVGKTLFDKVTGAWAVSRYLALAITIIFVFTITIAIHKYIEKALSGVLKAKLLSFIKWAQFGKYAIPLNDRGDGRQ